jgi:hypothetical protein
MKRLALCGGLFALAACQAPVEPAKAGRFQVVNTNEGVIRVDTQTGETQLMVEVADGPRKGFYATVDGRQLVWADVVHGNGHD